MCLQAVALHGDDSCVKTIHLLYKETGCAATRHYDQLKPTVFAKRKKCEKEVKANKRVSAANKVPFGIESSISAAAAAAVSTRSTTKSVRISKSTPRRSSRMAPRTSKKEIRFLASNRKRAASSFLEDNAVEKAQKKKAQTVKQAQAAKKKAAKKKAQTVKQAQSAKKKAAKKEGRGAKTNKKVAEATAQMQEAKEAYEEEKTRIHRKKIMAAWSVAYRAQHTPRKRSDKNHCCGLKGGSPHPIGGSHQGTKYTG